MEYIGDLYAKIANKYIKISDSETFDNMQKEIETLKQQVKDLSWQKLEVGVCEPEIGQIVDIYNLEYSAHVNKTIYKGNGIFKHCYYDREINNADYWKLTNLPV